MEIASIPFFFTANSFGRVTPTLLALIISVYLLTLRTKTRRTWLLFGYFFCMMLFNAAYVSAYAVYHPLGTLSWYLASFVLFGSVFKIQFTYHFPRLIFPKEARIALGVSLLLALWAYFDYVVRSLNNPTYYYIENHFFGSSRFSVLIPAVGLIAFLWTPIVMFRQWRHHRRANHPDEARAALRFVYVTLVEIAIAFLYMQDRFWKLVGPEVFEPLANAGVSLIFLLYVLIYLNLTSEPSSFIARLVGLSLLTVMLVTSTLGVLGLYERENAYDRQAANRARSALSYLRAGLTPPAGDLAYLAEADEVDAAAVANGDGAGDAATGDGVPRWRFLYRAPDAPGAAELAAADVRRSTLREGRSYRLTAQERFVTYHIEADGRRLEAGFPYTAYRLRIHQAALPHLFALLAVTAFMLIGFPLIIYAMVIGPLRRLLSRLRDAALDPELEAGAGADNELEYLSRSFASMLKLLKEAKGRFYEYSEHLGEVERLVENYREAEFLEQQVGDRTLVCASPAMRAVVRRAVRFSELDRPALVTGETGTGKELIARTMHFGGQRSAGPFVPVNCAAVPAALWESEVFGHVRGAFTDASKDRRGRVEEAAGGSLFFDEIGEMPLDMQAKMLRLLQERQYAPIGSDRLRQAECRFIFATNRDLEQMIQAGSFREDLYYRINVFHVHIPPLRERGADIPILVRRTLEDLAREEGGEPAAVEDRALAALVSYPWPGNIRELENVLTRAVAGEGLQELRIEHLPRQIAMASPRPGVPAAPAFTPAGPDMNAAGGNLPALTEKVDFDRLVEAYSRRLIEAALSQAGGNKTRAAELLGMKRTRLRYRIKELGLDGDAN